MRITSLFGCALLAGAALSGCMAHAPAVAMEDQDGQSVDDPMASELRNHYRHHHRGGVTQFIAMSLDTLATDEARRPTVEKLQDELFACLAPTRSLERTLLLNVADDVTADTRASDARIEDTIGELKGAAAAMPACSTETLNKLHAALSPDERAALVDKVEAHLDVWRQVNDEAEARGPAQGRRLAELTRELSLSPEQAERIATALDATRAGPANRFDRKPTEASLEVFAASFEQPAFDARSLAPETNGRLMTHGARRMVIFYDTVAPLLTPTQRAALAAQLREHANHQPAVSAK